MPGQLAQWRPGGLGGRVHRRAGVGEHVGDQPGGGGLSHAARTVHSDQETWPARPIERLAGHAGISGSSRRPSVSVSVVTGHCSVSTSPIRPPAATTAAGQPLPHSVSIEHAVQVAFAPTW